MGETLKRLSRQLDRLEQKLRLIEKTVRAGEPHEAVVARLGVPLGTVEKIAARLAAEKGVTP